MVNEKRNYIIGTAGHIDHGKTTLIGALTGSDTDRLKEEKERGISIELGFTDLSLSEDLQLGIIDVPGHEKFVKHMLAGAGGVDIALLVIAADEGIMAQTKEHLAILDLLQVERGLVALTKIDQVDEEWLELVKEDTRERLQGTFLEKAPIIPVSGVEGTGIKDLQQEIKNIVEGLPPKDLNDNVYYPIDRVFTLTGHGTVVTGTLVTGTINVEDKLVVYPQQKEVRVRSLQVHNDSVESAYPGQRVGINLAGVDKQDLDRGNVLATPESLPVTDFCDCRLHMMEDVSFILEHGDRIRFHIGAREVLGRVYMIEKEQLLPGESGLVQFRLEEEIVARYKENFVVRRYSPMTTIGGGVVIDNDPPYRKKLDKNAVRELEIKENGSEKERIGLVLKLKGDTSLTTEEISRNTNISKQKVKEKISELVEEGNLIKFDSGNIATFLHQEIYNRLVDEIEVILDNYHQKYSLRKGLPKEELKSKISVDLDKKEFDQIMTELIDNNRIREEQAKVALSGFEINYTEEEFEIKNEILNIFSNNVMPPTADQLSEEVNKDEELVAEVFQAIIEEGIICKVDHNIYFHQDVIKESEDKLINYLQSNKTIELSDFRDLLGSSRKYALPLLNYFEEKGVLIREGDKRRLA